MPVKAKRLVMDGTDVLQENAGTAMALDSARKDELRAIADVQLAEHRTRLIDTLERMGKGLTAWTAARGTAWAWEWPEPIDTPPPAEWKGLLRLALLFAYRESLRDAIGYLESFHTPLWCEDCHPGEPWPGNPWTKWACLDHDAWPVRYALLSGRDMFALDLPAESTPATS